MKCSGRGMHTRSSSFCVSLDDDVRIIHGNKDISQDWSMEDLSSELGPSHKGAIVSRNHIDVLTYHRLSESDFHA